MCSTTASPNQYDFKKQDEWKTGIATPEKKRKGLWIGNDNPQREKSGKCSSCYILHNNSETFHFQLCWFTTIVSITLKHPTFGVVLFLAICSYN